jgi:hypothetical protein
LCSSYRRTFGGAQETYVDNALDLTEHGSKRLPDEGNGREQSGLADQDVEEGLVNTDELLRCEIRDVVRLEVEKHTSRKASKILSASAPAGTRAIPFICWMAVVAVETISVKPMMIFGKGPWPMIINGPLMTLIDCAGPWRAWLFWVIIWMFETTWAGVVCAAATEKARAEAKMVRKETMIEVVGGVDWVLEEVF